MNWFKKAEARYQMFILSKIPKKLLRSQLFFFALMLLAIPVTVLFSQQFQQNTTLRIAGGEATPVNPPGTVNFGNALYATSGPDFMFTQPYSSSYTNAFTIEGWFNQRGAPSSGILLQKPCSYIDSLGRQVNVDCLLVNFTTTINPATGTLMRKMNVTFFNLVNRKTHLISIDNPFISNPAITTDQGWHNFAIVHDRVGGTGTLKLFIDGQIKGTSSGGDGVINGVPPFEGLRVTAPDGTLDELRLSNIALYSGNYDVPKIPYTSNYYYLLHFNESTIRDFIEQNSNILRYLDVDHSSLIPSTILGSITPTPTPSLVPTNTPVPTATNTPTPTPTLTPQQKTVKLQSDVMINASSTLAPKLNTYLKSIISYLGLNTLAMKSAACQQLTLFKSAVTSAQSSNQLSQALANTWRAAADDIRASIPCTN